jgi:ribose transport system permease protein
MMSAQTQRRSSPLKALRQMRWLAVLFGVLLLGLIFSQLSPAFLQLRNLQNITVQAAVTGVMAVGMTFVIMTAGIDISVGAIFYLAISLAASFTLNFTEPGMAYLAYPIAIGAGIIMGTINGLLTIVLRINPLITTLATLSIFRGLAIRITEARILTPPGEVRFLGIGDLFGVPMPIIVALVAVIIGTYVLSYTRFGRYVLAIGASQVSARESALPVRRTLILAYVIAGLCAGLAGMISLGRVGAVQSDMGIGIEFTVITAVVLGGTALSGGRGSIIGSLLGAILLVMIDNGLNLINASPFIYDAVRGTVLIGAVLLDRGASLQVLLRGFPLPTAARRMTRAEG